MAKPTQRQGIEPKQEQPTVTFEIIEQEYWLPGEQIRGCIIVNIPKSTTICKARIDFEGEWTVAASEYH